MKHGANNIFLRILRAVHVESVKILARPWVHVALQLDLVFSFRTRRLAGRWSPCDNGFWAWAGQRVESGMELM